MPAMFDFDPLITSRLRSIDASGIRKVFDLAARMENPINLSIGQPDFPVPESVQDAAVEAIRAGRNAYTQTQGIAPLLERTRDDFKSRFAREGRWSDPGALVTSGVSGGLLLALMTCVEAGDEVIVPDPYFVMYKHLVRMAGGTPVFVDTYPDFQLTAERVEPMLTERTKMIMLATPSNPTGVVASEATLRDLVTLCEARGILLLSDEIYDIFSYESVDTPIGPAAASPASFSENILVLRGFSKTYAMTGWRLGTAIGPRPIIDQMTKLQQYTFVCAPSMVQYAGLAALDTDMSSHVAAYRKKRDLVMTTLDERFALTEPGGAFYAFPKVPTDETAMQFVERAIAENVLIIPGSVFSERDTHFRISYATDDEKLERGLKILVKLAG